MRASKMDKLEGAAAEAVKKALLDPEIGTAALYADLDELGVVDEHELTESGIGYYLRTRRAAIAAGDMNPPDLGATESPQEEPGGVTALTTFHRSVAPGQGYVVLPGGEIWTGSPDAALELQRRILEKS
jgi:hypothetical protein